MTKASLGRRIGVVSATAIVVSNMIGTGIFTTTGFLAGDLGSPGLVIFIWVVGGAIALTGALSYVELAINFPRSGGELRLPVGSLGTGLGLHRRLGQLLRGLFRPHRRGGTGDLRVFGS